MKLYLCFCENHYTGDDVGQWYLEQPDKDKCHRQDNCGMYTVEMDDPHTSRCNINVLGYSPLDPHGGCTCAVLTKETDDVVDSIRWCFEHSRRPVTSLSGREMSCSLGRSFPPFDQKDCDIRDNLVVEEDNDE